ncbi:unnamed protein product [Lasius platythorax]|uniref:Uncharacterized protein n=1 Tax=Lasius platythorax TaxID=488582 RepID=A0AAV2NYE8_9HYME
MSPRNIGSLFGLGTWIECNELEHSFRNKRDNVRVEFRFAGPVTLLTRTLFRSPATKATSAQERERPGRLLARIHNVA